jgi:hypothetical protein
VYEPYDHETIELLATSVRERVEQTPAAAGEGATR